MPAVPRPSATIVLLRDSGRGLETLLLVRTPSSTDPFSGASVFPGGVVDARDVDATLPPDVDPDRVRASLAASESAERTHAVLVAACRELYEEAGILLARDRRDRPVSPKIAAALGTHRHAVQRGECSFSALLEERNLVADPSGLVPFAHWITPEFQPKRWDTHFFVARTPRGQEASSDGHETAHAEWLTPRNALDAYRQSSIALAPPTFRVLEDLRLYESSDQVLERARRDAPPATILPVSLEGAPAPTMLYPGDSEYPGHSGPPGRNRLTLMNGRWHSDRSEPASPRSE